MSAKFVSVIHRIRLKNSANSTRPPGATSFNFESKMARSRVSSFMPRLRSNRIREAPVRALRPSSADGGRPVGSSWAASLLAHTSASYQPEKTSWNSATSPGLKRSSSATRDNLSITERSSFLCRVRKSWTTTPKFTSPSSAAAPCSTAFAFASSNIRITSSRSSKVRSGKPRVASKFVSSPTAKVPSLCVSCASKSSWKRCSSPSVKPARLRTSRARFARNASAASTKPSKVRAPWTCSAPGSMPSRLPVAASCGPLRKESTSSFSRSSTKASLAASSLNTPPSSANSSKMLRIDANTVSRWRRTKRVNSRRSSKPLWS
mmetsp:Transcript_95528/g.275235  ORF Transcript_95528/g.275235 Transcript_95528/m.275235 type:complete len:320 (-) Transcript_95528:1675-2634(-)